MLECTGDNVSGRVFLPLSCLSPNIQGSPIFYQVTRWASFRIPNRKPDACLIPKTLGAHRGVDDSLVTPVGSDINAFFIDSHLHHDSLHRNSRMHGSGGGLAVQ